MILLAVLQVHVLLLLAAGDTLCTDSRILWTGDMFVRMIGLPAPALQTLNHHGALRQHCAGAYTAIIPARMWWMGEDLPFGCWQDAWKAHSAGQPEQERPSTPHW